MASPPGPLIASGRAADVFDIGDGRVLRRYRIDHDTADEARLMQWLDTCGIPVPAVHDAQGRDLVMELVGGPTMLADLEARPWLLVQHGRQLAGLQQRLGAVAAPTWLQPRDGVPDGTAVLHLDLHPMNVIMSTRGPVLIDWTNSARGAAGFDAAYTHVLMSTFEVRGLRDRIARDVLVRTFGAARGRQLVHDHLADACAHRLSDPAITPGEVDAVRALTQRPLR